METAITYFKANLPQRRSCFVQANIVYLEVVVETIYNNPIIYWFSDMNKLAKPGCVRHYCVGVFIERLYSNPHQSICILMNLYVQRCMCIWWDTGACLALLIAGSEIYNSNFIGLLSWKLQSGWKLYSEACDKYVTKKFIFVILFGTVFPRLAFFKCTRRSIVNHIVQCKKSH